MGLLQKLMENARRKQQQIPGQLGIPDDGLTIGDIEIEEAWQEHVRERRQAMARMRVVESHNVSGAIIHEPVGFSRWASEEEALQEWRDRTLHSLDLRHICGGGIEWARLTKAEQLQRFRDSVKG